MSYDISACEYLLQKYAPAILRAEAEDEPRNGPKRGQWRPKTSAQVVRQMHRMRANGYTIGKIARKVHITYGTVQRWLASGRTY